MKKINNTFSRFIRKFANISLLAVATVVMSANAVSARDASFKEFDERAKAGERLSVVFFGGSLTWGANSADPNITSYRGRMMKYLKERYPMARFDFHDAAIGGTGSDLGVFRVERDVLSKNPDIVFLDFTANDRCEGTDLPTAKMYETIVNILVSHGVPVEQMYFGFKCLFENGTDPFTAAPRRAQYMKIATAYQLAEGDIFPLINDAIKSGETTPDKIWPLDVIHPCEIGYEYFFQAAKKGFEAAVSEGKVCMIPEKPVYGLATEITRLKLAGLEQPNGWRTAISSRTGLWFDGQPSRWQDGVSICTASSNTAPFIVKFKGNTIGFFGESDKYGLDISVKLDGKQLSPSGKDNSGIWNFSQNYGDGNIFIWRISNSTIPSGEHTLEISPSPRPGYAGGELKIESVCTANLP